jgi:selenocysteine lyase/cysteine desulfurase
MEDEAFWEVVRAQYPVTRERVYFNTGGLGPAPYPVLDAVEETTRSLQSVSETGHRLFEDARPPVSSFFGVHPSEIAFLRNATEGNSTIAQGLTLRRNDEVIFETHAHPGGAIPWMSRQKRDGIKVRVFEPDPSSAAGNLERIEAIITERTRVIQVSHVTAPTGIRFPVEEIARLARDRGIWFHIDGAQSAGMFPIDLKAIGCDSYATSGHKWMGAPHGTGILYVPEERLDDVAPTEVGAYSDRGEGGFVIPDILEYTPKAQRYEPGTRNAALIAGIVEAVRFLERIGMERVAKRGQTLARRLQDGLRELPGVAILTPSDPTLSGSITTFKSDRVPYNVLFTQLLEKHNMRCRVVTEEGLDALRVSTHVFTAVEEVDRLIAATREILQTP